MWGWFEGWCEGGGSVFIWCVCIVWWQWQFVLCVLVLCWSNDKG